MLKKLPRNARRQLTGWLIAALTALFLTSEPVDRLYALPDSLRLTPGCGASLSMPPLTEINVEGEAAVLSSLDESLSDSPGSIRLSAGKPGSASVTLRLMGLFPIKTIPVSVDEECIVMPGGSPVGVAIRTQGVLVVGASDLGGATVSPARKAGLLPGDMIQAVDGSPVTGSRHLSNMISSGEPVILTVLRGDETLSLPLIPALDPRDSVYRLGAWVRDSTAGIGTLSFYDPATGRFGALGHAITDIDTGLILDVQDGEIVQSDITEIHRGEIGAPGELVGQFGSGSPSLGKIDCNGELGIYGSAYQPLINPLYPEGIPVMSGDEVHTGPAQLLTTLDSSGIRPYDCEIIKLTRQNKSLQRSMVLRITDPELLKRTGGIVQGMSGSPIIQDGKLVGAVTHVLVNSPDTGYGIFIENMLEAAS